MTPPVPPPQGSHPFTNPEPLLTTLARLFAYEGKAAHVAVLAFSRPSMEQTDFDGWDGGIDIHTLYLYVTASFYAQLGDKDRGNIEEELHAKASSFLDEWKGHRLSRIRIMPEMTTDDRWRDKATAWLTGSGISNQGRVRSNNIAARSCDGLLFRSQPEIFLYQALKSLGVSFAPLPVFVRGGESYRRIEPDFVLLKDGALMVVEVDGDTVHQETPAEAHDRTTMLLHEGAFVERVRARDCETLEKARSCAERLVLILTQRRAAR